jgi:hypothetical protein
MIDIVGDIHVVKFDIENIDEKCNKIKCEPILNALKKAVFN